MEAHDVQLETADGPARGYEVSPDGAPRGAVVVVPEAFGLNAHIEEVTERFAAAGYLALSVDVFHRAGGGTAPYDDFRAAMALSAGLTDEGFLRDLDAAIRHLATRGMPTERVGVVGFCVGGRFAFLAALAHALGAAVSYYGGGIVSQGAFRNLPPLLGEVGRLQTPWLGLFGDLDTSIPTDDVELLRDALGAGSVPVELVRYPGAGHGFNCDARESFDEASSLDAFGRTVDWLAQHVR